MNLENIRKLFLGGLILVGFLFFLITFASLDLTDSSKTQENTDKITGAMVNVATPIEVSWLVWGAEKLKNNSYLLLLFIVFIAWLFGYIKFKK